MDLVIYFVIQVDDAENQMNVDTKAAANIREVNWPSLF